MMFKLKNVKYHNGFGPISMIMKFSPFQYHEALKPYKPMIKDMKLCYTEARTYHESIPQQFGIAAPKGFFGAYDHDLVECIIIMEDLHPRQCLDQIKGVSFQDAKLALSTIAKLHGATWNDKSAVGWARDSDKNALLGMWSANWGVFTAAVEEFGFAVSSHFYTMCEVMNTDHGGVIDYWKDNKRSEGGWLDYSIVHSDYRASNIFANSSTRGVHYYRLVESRVYDASL